MKDVDECAGMVRRGEYEKAVRHLSRLASREPNDPGVNILKGLALYNLGKYPEALKACIIAINYGADISEEHEELRDMCNAEKMYDKASECGLTAALMDEIIMKAKYVGAKALFRMGVRDEAIHEINFEVQLDLGNPDERHILTMILSEMCYMEDVDSADAASIEHMHSEMFRDLWSRHEQYKKKLEERLKAADSAIALHGDEAGNHTERAKILFGMEKYRDALEAITEALNLNPPNARYHYVKADVLRMLGRMPECRKEAEESLSLDPDDQEARALDGFCLYREGRRDEGRAMIGAAYKKDPGRQMTCYYMAFVTSQEGERKEALGVCKSAMLRHPENQELRFLMVTMLEEVLKP